MTELHGCSSFSGRGHGDPESAPMDAEDYPDTAPGTSHGAGDGKTELVPAATAATPEHAWSNEEPVTEALSRPWRSVWAIACMGLLAAVIVAFAIFGVVALLREHHGGTQTGQTAPTTPTYSPSAPAPQSPAPPQAAWAPAPTTAQLRISSLPGTDDLGWTAYRNARCDSGNQLAVMARTTRSVLVVCQLQPGNFYYRGVRLSDGASIELANAVRFSEGFEVTNPTDGTRYQIRPTSLTIAPPDGRASSEPMLQYASS